ncbi:hypothetical protein [Clostridium beijerinckii]|uniref:hypothetical protein n=1 Tax=Clostridium beijerinckii TaxID=1520 RepID=UPI00157032FD|nr:hypothetical protein [Clostridium beijerinckii]NRT70021.1 hypothetical protein [Clostridium beijerinckii]
MKKISKVFSIIMCVMLISSLAISMPAHAATTVVLDDSSGSEYLGGIAGGGKTLTLTVSGGQEGASANITVNCSASTFGSQSLGTYRVKSGESIKVKLPTVVLIGIGSIGKSNMLSVGMQYIRYSTTNMYVTYSFD